MLAFWLVVAGFFALLAVFFAWPLVVSTYRRWPALLFPRSSLRIAMLRQEVNKKGWRGVISDLFLDKRSLLTYWSFLWAVPLGFLVVTAFVALDLSLVDRFQVELVQHGWQAQLTLTSLSFIVLIFLLEQMSRTEYREGVIQEFFGSTRIMPIIYFTLGSSGYLAYLYFTQASATVAPHVADATFLIFLGTVLGIGYVYYRVARLIFFDPLDEMTVQQVQRGINLKLRDQDRRTVSETAFEAQLPDFVDTGVNHDGRVYMAQELGLDGYVTDIDMAQVTAVCHDYADWFNGEDNPTLLLNVRLGDELQPGLDVVSATYHGTLDTLPDAFAADLADAIYCSDVRPWKTGDRLIDRNLGRIGEDTRATINSLNPTRLELMSARWISNS